jgi:hypothetical protein
MASTTRTRLTPDLRPLRRAAFGALGLALAPVSHVAQADEGGVSFWIPGTYGSYAATPSEPGWSFETIYYHASDATRGNATFVRGGVTLTAGLASPLDLLMFTPSYVFATPVLGGQAAVGMQVIFGKNTTSVAATLSGPSGVTISGTRSDDVVGFGDLSPNFSLTWNRDVHNFMVYATSGIPTGAYQATRLSNIGIGHWAVDSGAGYTYLNEKAKFEWSAVLGFTYNFINPYTQYQSGIDAHLDWGISPYASEKMHIGIVGYFYNQLTSDSGPGATLGEFKSQVVGIGPQVGFFFPFAGQEGYLNFKTYYEFDAKNRLEGWKGWITFSVEPPERKSQPVAPRS